MKLLSMQFPPVPSYFLPLRPNIFLSTVFSNILSLCSSLNVRDRVSHPYKRISDEVLHCLFSEHDIINRSICSYFGLFSYKIQTDLKSNTAERNNKHYRPKTRGD
jgi:hypothetical protein